MGIVMTVFVVCLLLGIPIAFMLGLTGMTHILVINPALLLELPQKLFSSASSSSLLAIPLFIIAGDLMNKSGDVDRLMRFVRSLVGQFKGGLCYVTVLLGLLLGSSLASSNAEAAMLSKSLYPKLKEEGYDSEFLAGLISATSVIGPLIPPGLLMVIYGVASGVSIKSLFLAGIMPGILLAIALCSVVFFTSLRHTEWPVRAFQGWKEVWDAFKGAILSLGLPVCVLIFIAAGICTPTEAAAVLSFLFMVNGLFNYKTLKVKDVFDICLSGGITAGAILIIGSMGGIFGWTLAYDQIPQKITSGILAISQNPYVVLLILNVLILFLGMIMDSVPAVMILVPVLMPLIQKMGYNPVHFGIIICFNLTIGLFTPPVGTVLYTTALSTGVPVNNLFKSIWPWVGVCVLVLFICMYIPGLIMFIPRLIG